MQKKLALLISLFLLIALTACGGSPSSGSGSATGDQAASGTVSPDTSVPSSENTEADAKPDLSQYTEIGETYGKLTAAKKDSGEWFLIHAEDSAFEPQPFREIVGLYGNILVVNRGEIKEKYPKLSIETVDSSTGNVLDSYRIYASQYDRFLEDIDEFPSAIQIDDTLGGENLLINTKTLSVYAGDFSQIDGLAALCYKSAADSKFYFLDLEQDTVFGHGYTSVDKNIFENKIRVEKDGYWGCVDLSGNTVIDFLYNKIGEFHNGAAPVQYGENWALLNDTNELVIQPIYNAFRGYADKDCKYLIFDREDLSGAELLYYDATVIIPEEMFLFTSDDNERILQSYCDFYVDVSREFIFAYATNREAVSFRLGVHNLDGTLRYIHPLHYVSTDAYGKVGDAEDLEALEKTAFDHGPIRLLIDGSWNHKCYYLFEDGSVTEEFTWGTRFEKEGYAVVEDQEYNDAKESYGFHLMDQTGTIVKDLGYNITQAYIHHDYLVYENDEDDLWYIRSLTDDSQTGPFSTAEETVWADSTGETSEFILVQDAQTKLYGIFCQGKWIADSVYPEIRIDAENARVVLMRGTRQETKSFAEIFQTP